MLVNSPRPTGGRPLLARPSVLASLSSLAALALLALSAAPALAASAADRDAAATVRRIVIDPGHGGSETGAQGKSGVVEKELTLDVARRLAALLRADGFEVTLTREGDDDKPLDDRAGLANNQRADVFLSLHANASRFTGAHGAETFVLSREATDDAARTTAALENDAVGIGEAGGASAAGAAATGDGDLPLILWDLAQVSYLEDSMRLAGVIQERLNSALGLKDRGVRQAPFRVLRGATCPAVLVELGFLSNADEEKALASPDHRARLADALADALRAYRARAVAQSH